MKLLKSTAFATKIKRKAGDVKTVLPADIQERISKEKNNKLPDTVLSFSSIKNRLYPKGFQQTGSHRFMSSKKKKKKKKEEKKREKLCAEILSTTRIPL